MWRNTLEDDTNVHYTADAPVSDDVLEEILERVSRKYGAVAGQGEQKKGQATEANL